MTNAFNLPSLFFGIYLIIPLVLGCFLLFGVNIKSGTLTKAQRLAGVLLLLDALYLIIRTTLIAQVGLHSPVLRCHFFIMDSTMLTIFALIPYTVVTERYPKWWMILLAISPMALIPAVHLTHTLELAKWSHILPLIASIIVLLLSIKHAREADKGLKDEFANPEEHEKSWIIALCACFVVVTIASFLRYLLHGFGWYNLTVSCMWSALMIAIYVLLTHQKSSCGGGETAIFDPEIKKTAEISNDTKLRNYETIRQALTKCANEQIYLRGDLSIDTLAHECSTNRTYLSSYLKDELHQNFYEYINSMRLQQVEELIKNPRLSQEAIAQRCGFNSARTMRSVFLKLRGETLKR